MYTKLDLVTRDGFTETKDGKYRLYSYNQIYYWMDVMANKKLHGEFNIHFTSLSLNDKALIYLNSSLEKYSHVE